MDSIKAVNTAVDESTKGVTNVTEMSMELTNNVKEINDEADNSWNDQENQDKVEADTCRFADIDLWALGKFTAAVVA